MSYFYRPYFKVQGLDLVEEIQQNPCYDPSKSCNGGGYDQPYLKFQGPAGTLEIDDTSCGDFGSRYSVKYTTPQGKSYSYSYNSMDEDEDGMPYEEGGIPANYDGIIRFCHHLGYWVQGLDREKKQEEIMSKENLEEMQVEEAEKYVAAVYKAHLQAAAKEAPDREAVAAEEKRYNAVRPTRRALQGYMHRDPDISRLSPEERRASFRTVQDLRQEMPKLYSRLRATGKDFEKSKDNSRNQGMER